MTDRFPATRLSVVRDLRDPDESRRASAFEAIVAAYWRPVYAYLRLWKRLSPEDAEDVTQGFFAYVLEKQTLERYDPERARFRTWIRVCLDGFLANERKAARRQKRGYGYAHVGLDFRTAEGDLSERELPAGVDTEAFFHREWVRGLLGDAVDELRAESDELSFRIFERYDLDDPLGFARPTYAALAEELGLPVTKVTNQLHAMRRKLRELVVARLARVCASEEEVEDEAKALFRGLSR